MEVAGAPVAMKILVANLGSTSFKYRLFEMDGERQLARGGVERIGATESACFVEIEGRRRELTASVPDHAVAVRHCLSQLTDPRDGCLASADEVAAIGFKAVHGGRISGVQRVDADVLAAMEEMNDVAPAHNPPYIAAMRLLAERLPEIPLVAAFETDFHQTIGDDQRFYAIPHAWSDEYAVRRFGFHGASHRYIATRMVELTGRSDLRMVSCHLGGSSSLCAIRAGKSVGTSMGMSPQSGLPQNNRVGDFDPFALPVLMRRTGLSLEAVLDTLANQGGLLGLSGVSGDIRDLQTAAAAGHVAARRALDVYVADIRRHLGGLLVLLGGADALVFTGGIGEHSAEIRRAVCANLGEFGIELDESRNTIASGEMTLQSPTGRVAIWILPTNEELVVARQTAALLRG
jgi:acetate kinase